MTRYWLLLSTLFVLGACTENERARNYGGNITKSLPDCRRLVNVTWKTNDLWVVTRPMNPDETPTTYEFQEDSSLGVMNGTITFVESCSRTTPQR